MKLPCKPKYVDEAVDDWVIFEVTPYGFDIVYATDWTKTVFHGLTKQQAMDIAAIHDRFKTELHNYMDMKS